VIRRILRGEKKQPLPIDKFVPSLSAKKLITKIFIDTAFWRRHWHCHCLPERSFSLNKRQFQICARCTGLAVGIIISPISLIASNTPSSLWQLLLLLFLLDGSTQALGLRKSNNSLRFVSGLATPMAIVRLALEKLIS